jgi:hypothetical protein
MRHRLYLLVTIVAAILMFFIVQCTTPAPVSESKVEIKKNHPSDTVLVGEPIEFSAIGVFSRQVTYIWREDGEIIKGEDGRKLIYIPETVGQHTISVEIANSNSDDIKPIATAVIIVQSPTPMPTPTPTYSPTPDMGATATAMTATAVAANATGTAEAEKATRVAATATAMTVSVTGVKVPKTTE